MSLSATEKRSLTMGLSEALTDVEVSIWGVLLPALEEKYLDGELVKKTAKHLDTGGIDQFFRDHINEKLASAGQLVKNGKIHLKDIPGFSDNIALAKEAVASLAPFLGPTLSTYVARPAFTLALRTNHWNWN